MPRHSPCALCSLTFCLFISSNYCVDCNICLFAYKVPLTTQIFCLLALESTKPRKHFSILVNLLYFRHICFNQYHKEYLFLACCILYTIINMQFSKNNIVGLNGLEPSTSRLSGVRSNQLSYKPFYNLAATCSPMPSPA